MSIPRSITATDAFIAVHAVTDEIVRFGSSLVADATFASEAGVEAVSAWLGSGIEGWRQGREGGRDASWAVCGRSSWC